MTKQEKFRRIAMELIYKKGFKAMTMRDLAVAMNCDVSNIYNYTASKNDLLEQHVFAISEEFHHGLAEIMSSRVDASSKIKQVIKLHIRLASIKPFTVALLNNEYRNLKADKLEEFIAKRNAYEKQVESIIEEGMKTGIFSSDSTAVTRSILLGSLRWIYTEFATEGHSINAIDLENTIVNFVMSGILVEKEKMNK